MSSVIQKVLKHIGSCFSYITRSSEVGSSEQVQKLSHSLRAPASVQIRSPPSLVDKLSSRSTLPHGYKMCAVPPAVTCILPAESKRSKQGAIVSILEKQKRTTRNFNIPFVGLNRVTSLPLVLRKSREAGIFNWVHFHHPLKSGERMLGRQVGPSAEVSGLVWWLLHFITAL